MAATNRNPPIFRGKAQTLLWLLGPTLRVKALQTHHEPHEKIANDIKSLLPQVVALIEGFDRTEPGNRAVDALQLDKFSSKDWSNYAFQEALDRLRLLLEQNFVFVETLGLLAAARFVFEQRIWFKFLAVRPENSWAFFSELSKQQLDAARGYKAQCEFEVELFERLEKQGDAEQRAISSSLQAATDKELSAEEYVQRMRRIEEKLDEEASLNLCTYSDDARVNGYSFQAYLIKKKAIPHFDAMIKEYEDNWQRWGRIAPQPFRQTPLTKWKWDQRSQEVGLKREYEFLYRYTSRLLHATPMAFGLVNKLLDDSEISMLLKFVRYSMVDMLRIAERQLHGPAH